MATKQRREELIKIMQLGHLPHGEDRELWVDRLRKNLCPTCGKPVVESEFRDDLSRKEYGISNMCQSCQDEIFSPSDYRH